MDNRIKQAFEEARASVEVAMKKLRDNRREAKDWEKNNPDLEKKVGGIYAFWKNGEAIYVGRAKNILRRYKQHFLFDNNKSPLARKLARESLAKDTGGCEGKEYLIARYGHLKEDNDIREKIKERLQRDDIKDRMYAMEFSFYEQKNTLQQYLLEMFCSIGLETVHLNDKGEEKCNIEPQEEAGKAYYKYSFYNSFKTS